MKRNVTQILPNMSKTSTSKDSQTDWERIHAMQDEDIDLSDIPEVTENQMARATLRIGGKPVPKGKVRVNILLDANVVAYFKTQAGGQSYQTLINEALKTNILHHDLESMLRRVIHEELHSVRCFFKFGSTSLVRMYRGQPQIIICLSEGRSQISLPSYCFQHSPFSPPLKGFSYHFLGKCKNTACGR